MQEQTAPPADAEIMLYFSANPGRNWTRLSKFHDGFLSAGKKREFAVIGFDPHGRERILLHDVGGRNVHQFVYGIDSLAALAYPRKIAVPFRLKPGNCDIPVLLFWHANRNRARYWVMEDDVEYSGDPAKLFEDLESAHADLMATHLHNCHSDWDYFSRFRSAGKVLAPEDIRLCFLPFFSISGRALEVIDACYRDGWDGHHEMTWPTILKSHGMSILDIGGQGPYVTEAYRGRHYLGTPGDGFQKRGSFGTLNIRLRAGRMPNVLWHPVKPFMAWYPQQIKRMASIFSWYRSAIKDRLV